MTTETVPAYACSGRVDFRAALSRIARERSAMVDVVWTHNDRKSSENLPDINVPDGTILRLTVFSGLPRLVLTSGRLIFRAHSAWGNALTVQGGHAHVITDGADRKVTINLRPDLDRSAEVTTAAGEVGPGSRMFVWGPHAPTGNRPIIVPVSDAGLPESWQPESAASL